jgi:hypothetical protein
MHLVSYTHLSVATATGISGIPPDYSEMLLQIVEIVVVFFSSFLNPIHGFDRFLPTSKEPSKPFHPLTLLTDGLARQRDRRKNLL